MGGYCLSPWAFSLPPHRKHREEFSQTKFNPILFFSDVKKSRFHLFKHVKTGERFQGRISLSSTPTFRFYGKWQKTLSLDLIYIFPYKVVLEVEKKSHTKRTRSSCAGVPI